MRSTLLAGVIALLAIPGTAAGAGGSGFLPKGEKPPSTYEEILDEPNGLRLLEPPATLARNTDGEAGAMRFYAGVRFLRASRRLGVASVRVALLRTSGRHRLLARVRIRPAATSRWRFVFLDGAGSGRDHVIRYAVKLRDGRTIGRSFSVTVPEAG